MEHKKNDDINKLLNFELTPDEEKKFKNSEGYKDYKDILELFENTKAIPFDKNIVLNKINTNKSEKSLTNTKVIPLYRKWLPMAIAATVLLCISLFYFNSITPKAYNTIAGESMQFLLPDSSSVWLNAASKISHNKDWKNSRDITLDGEAYFEVAKGKTFTVKTQQGIVTVLGTKFNVKQRDSFFEVHCFEGSVSVVYNNIKTILKPNNFFNSKLLEKQIKNIEKPSWVENKSIFHNTNIDDVLKDISIQYGVEFILDKNIKNQSLEYTGSYNYSDDLETVIVILCKSLDLNYNIKHKQIYLSL